MATGKLSRLVIGALAALAVAGAGPALAQHGGGGGGGHGGGGGGFHGGGAFHGGGGGFRGGGGIHRGALGYRGAGGFRGGAYGGGGRGGYGRGGYGRGGYGRGGYGWGGYGGAGWLGYGLLFGALPLAYATYYWDGVPYYYADDNYYQWDSDANEYQTVEPPAGLVNQVSAAAPTDAAQPDLFAYPQNGQPATQQAKDRSDCQQWAAGQVGSDATRHADYLRAEAACLTGKGYSVR
jgi:hypothetical protein